MDDLPKIPPAKLYSNKLYSCIRIKATYVHSLSMIRTAVISMVVDTITYMGVASWINSPSYTITYMSVTSWINSPS